MTDQTEAHAAEQQPDVEESHFAICEIMGHRRLAGRIREVERFGTKMLRIDIPTNGDFAQGFTTQYYAGSALFSVTDTDLATVCKMNKPYERARPLIAAPEPGIWRDDSTGICRALTLPKRKRHPLGVPSVQGQSKRPVATA